ncbi:GrpB family protein [Actinospica robiniae]|uniref:GrpB family protein n=1 Tax=Actinospica robiniae TaxID=304901 RepID=UPI000554DD91|nr:GrpB family protein [Actinospica robiniae]
MSILIAEYDPGWPGWAAGVAEELFAALPGVFTRIEHVGSTSVPGLAAKPVIDLMAGVTSLDEAGVALGERLPALSFQVFDTGMPGRLFYFRERDGVRVCHLHVVPESTFATRNEVLLRDLLRRTPEDVARYGALKRELAVVHDGDSLGYTRGKTALIQELVDRARAEAGLERVDVWEE